MTPDDLDLDALAAVAEKATPDGPWEAVPHRARRDSLTIHSKRGDLSLAHYVFAPVAEHMATFSPDAVLALIARVRAAEAERDEARRRLELMTADRNRVEYDAQEVGRLGHIAQTERDKLYDEVTRLRVSLAGARAERNSLQAERDDLAAKVARVEAACAKAELLTQEAMGHASQHWRGPDYADGLDAGIEVTTGLVRDALGGGAS